MSDFFELASKAKRIEYAPCSNDPHNTGGKNSRQVLGFDEKGNCVFKAYYDDDGNFRLETIKDKNGMKEKRDFGSDDLENASAFCLSDKQIKELKEAQNFVSGLKQKEPKSSQFSPKNPAEMLKNGMNVKLSEKSRLPFAPDIEELTISKGEDGVLRMRGISKDGKQSIDFSYRDGIAQFELTDGKTKRSYNNKMGGKWTYRDLTSSNGTRYFDSDCGELVASTMGKTFDKVKQKYLAPQKSQNMNKALFSSRGKGKE